MYAYLYDTFVSEAKHQTQLARIETRLTDLGIAGKISRLSLLTSIAEHVDEAIKKGADTIVAVGNDATFTKMLAVAAHRPVTFGLIPLGQGNTLAELLDLPYGDKACDILSARIIEKLDLGQANHHFFLSHLEIPSAEKASILVDNAYTVRPTHSTQSVRVCNLRLDATGGSWPSSPYDGRIELVIPEAGGRSLSGMFGKSPAEESVFRIRQAEITATTDEGHNAVVDGQTIVTLPISVSVLSKHLRVIVGKNRKFS